MRFPHAVRRPRRLLAGLAAAALAAPLTALPATPASSATASAAAAADAPTQPRRAGTGRRIAYADWGTDAELRAGTAAGTVVRAGRVELAAPVGTRRWAGRTYDVGRWTSPWAEPGFAVQELIPSWDATTPGGSWVQVEVRARRADGTTGSWDTLARWSDGDAAFRRTTGGTQTDDLGRANVDTWVAAVADATAWQVRVTLHRRSGETAAPSLDGVGAVASRLPATVGTTSRPLLDARTVVDVPRSSQQVHRGHSPQWGGGGQAWCSPTSTSMVLQHLGLLPPARAYSWVPDGHVDPWVDHAARMTFDHAYDGTGNWAFNTAYAAARGADAFVTRLRSVREAELFLAQGIPLVTSIDFASGELTGAPISGTDGHLLVLVGVTETGDVVVNDPAAYDRAGVRRTYDRAQFERAWLEGSGGLAYVITGPDQALPDPGTRRNW